MTPGEKIKHLRKKHNISVVALGKAMGKSPSVVYNLENDIHLPNLDHLLHISEVFGISLDEFMKGVEIK